MHHLLDLLEAPDPDTIEKFLSSLPMIFDVGDLQRCPPCPGCQARMHAPPAWEGSGPPAGTS